MVWLWRKVTVGGGGSPVRVTPEDEHRNEARFISI
jgi:hypothetical protein